MPPTDAFDVTVVSGLPRSGTSLMMQMLEAAGRPILTDGNRQPDDDNPAGYYEFEPVKRTRDDASWVAEAHGQTVKVIYLLLYDLPTDFSYRVIFMRRNLAEVAASQAAMLQRRGEPGVSQNAQQLVELFERQLAKLDRWTAGQGHLNWLDVDYNRLIEDPQPAIEAVDEFLGGGLDRQAMMAMIDTKLYRQRR